MFIALTALLFSGVVQAAISPPWNLVWLHPVAWVPAMAVFSRLSGRRALLAGWLVGAAASLIIFQWLPGTIHDFGNLPESVAVAVWLLFAAVTGFYTAIFAWGFGRIRRVAGSAWPLAVAVWFCALEFLNPQIFGFLQGVAWYQFPRVFLWSAFAGVSGVSFLVLLCNGVVLQAIELRTVPSIGGRRAWLRNVALLVVGVAAAVGYSSARLAAIDELEQATPAVRIAVIQPNHTIARRRELSHMRSTVFAEDMVTLSEKAASRVTDGRPIDVFVWPEGALRVDPSQRRNASVLEFVGRSGAEVWTGANHEETVDRRVVRAHNSAFRVYGDGQLDRRYDKNILVPFGEYVPLRDVVPGFSHIQTVGNFEAGTSVPRYNSGSTRFVFLICYEAIRSAFVRAAIGGDANLIVNVTADAWYGDSSEQSQHLMLAASQSAMNGLPMVRSTTTGISAFVDARGMITAQTGKFTREVLVADVRPMRLAGFYSRVGDWFAWLCVAGSAMLLLASRSDSRWSPSKR